MNFVVNLCTLGTTIFLQQHQRQQNICTVSKWRPNNRFSFRVILISAKTNRQINKEIFNEISLKIGNHGYINIAEIKSGLLLLLLLIYFFIFLFFYFFLYFFYYGVILGTKHFFCTPKIPIDVIQRENDAADLNLLFSSPKEAQLLSRSITKIIIHKYCSVNMQEPKKTNVGCRAVASLSPPGEQDIRIFPQPFLISLYFSHFSSHFLHFLPHFSLPGAWVGRSLG